MKEKIFLFITAIFVCFQQVCAEGKVRLRLIGEPSESRVLITVMDSLFRNSTTDTLTLSHGATDLPFLYGSPRLLAISSIPDLSSMKRTPGQQVVFVMLPGQDVTLAGTLAAPQLDGGEFFKQQNLVWQQVRRPSRLQYDSLFVVQGGDGAAQRAFEKWQSDHQLRALTFMHAHPDWDASAVLLCELSGQRLDEGLTLLSEGVKRGPLHQLVEEKQRIADHRQQQLQAADNTRIGLPASDFALSDSTGAVHRLSELRGRYVIIDFWASWCVPCRMGMPQLKNFASSHRSRLSVLGVATWDVDEGWRRALRTLQLPWVNVFCKKGVAPDAAAMYAVKGLPTKVLVSPDGRILLRQEGEDDLFYEQIDKIIDSEGQ